MISKLRLCRFVSKEICAMFDGIYVSSFTTELRIAFVKTNLMCWKAAKAICTGDAGWPRVTMCIQVAYELHVPRTLDMILDPATAPRWSTRNATLPIQTVPDVLWTHAKRKTLYAWSCTLRDVITGKLFDQIMWCWKYIILYKQASLLFLSSLSSFIFTRIIVAFIVLSTRCDNFIFPLFKKY